MLKVVVDISIFLNHPTLRVAFLKKGGDIFFYQNIFPPLPEENPLI